MIFKCRHMGRNLPELFDITSDNVVPICLAVSAMSEIINWASAESANPDPSP